jgi:hypothetical protein
MPSPFPGLDPYLEAHWRDVHTALMIYARDAIQDQLPGDLFARVEEGVEIDSDAAIRTVSPDVQVVESRTGWSNAGPATALAVAEPMVLPVEEPITERHIEICDRSSGGRVVTAIEFLSPTNKIPGEGREQYKQKQREYLGGGVNLVEVDLIRTGQHTISLPQRAIPKDRRTGLYACIRRSENLGLAHVYDIALNRPLPSVAIPLRPTDQDIGLDLQLLMTQAYDRGRYAATIDYTQDADPALPPNAAQWAEQLLRTSGKRN